MTPKEILVKARELLSDESRWTQMSSARDRSGRHECVYSEKAVRFCLLGAIDHVVGRADTLAKTKAKVTLANHVPARDVIGFNDNWFRSHKEILAALDAAIKAAEGGGN